MSCEQNKANLKVSMTVILTNKLAVIRFEFYIIGLIVIIVQTSQAEPQCKHRGSGCKIYCTDIPNHGDVTIDISSIDSTTGMPRYRGIKESRGKYSYDWNPCTKFSIPGSSACKGVNMCQQSLTQSSEFNVGSALEVIYEDKHIILKYTGDGERKSAVKMVYEKGENGRVSIVTENPTSYYSMTLFTKFSLNDSSSSGGVSTGTIIVIIFFVLLVLYFGVGITFLKYKRQAQGKDMIPNYAFWSMLPGLIKDGCIFTWKKAKGCCLSVKEQATKGESEKDQYEKI